MWLSGCFVMDKQRITKEMQPFAEKNRLRDCCQKVFESYDERSTNEKKTTAHSCAMCTVFHFQVVFVFLSFSNW